MTWITRLRLRIAALFCKPKKLFYIIQFSTLANENKTCPLYPEHMSAS